MNRHSSQTGRKLEPLRIVHTVSSLKFGGMENFVVQLAAEQQRRGHRASILALDPGPLLEKALAHRLDVVTLGNWGRPARLIRGLAFLAAARPDIIHSHNATSLHYGAIGRKSTGAKLVLTDHGVKMMRTPSGWEIRQIDALVGVSQKTADDHRNAYGGIAEFRVIHNGSPFRPSTRACRDVLASLQMPSGVAAIVAARLEPVKDIETLLRAVAIVNRRGGGDSLNVIIAGDGSERQRLEELAPALGLQPDRIRFLGFRTDMADLLAASDMFLLSSRNEGLPLALLEAMAQGLPVVATSVGGIPELMRSGEHGFLVPPGAPDAMARKIELLMQDSGLREQMGQASRRHVEKAFSWDGMASRYEDLYYSL